MFAGKQDFACDPAGGATGAERRSGKESRMAASVYDWFGGITYPAGKDAIREAVKANGAPQDILAKVEKLDERKVYRAPQDVFYELELEA